MDKTIKIILSILFFLCLADMPYGYYQFVRFAAMIGFGILAFQSAETENKSLMIIYGGLALLKIALGRELWNVVDVIVGIGLIISLFANKQQTKD